MNETKDVYSIAYLYDRVRSPQSSC